MHHIVSETTHPFYPPPPTKELFFLRRRLVVYTYTQGIFHLPLSADLGLRRGVVGNLPGLEPSPLVSLNVDADGPQSSGGNQDLHAHLLAVVHLGLGGPVEKFDNVLGHLGGAGGSAILVLDEAVVQNTSHTNTSAGEVGVEVHAGGDLDTSRGLLRVTSQQAEDVVAATVAGLDDQAQIRGKSTVVGKSSSLVVLVRRRNVVGQLSGSHGDLTLLIGLIGVFVLLSQGLGLVDGQDGTDESSVGDSGQGVAAGADFTVDLETTSETV